MSITAKFTVEDEGKTFIIDKDFANGGDVILVKVLGKLHCTVRDPETGGEWETMQYRLTQKTQ